MAQSGDETAKKVIEEQLELLVVVIVNAVNLFNPGTVIIGGPLVSSQKVLDGLAEQGRGKALQPFTKKLDLQRAGHDGSAALSGMTNYILDRDFFRTLSV